VPAVRVDGPGHEAGVGAEREGDRVERVVQRTERGGLGDLALLRRRRILALGQPVDPVVEQHDLDVDVASQRVDQVVAADGQRVAVAGDDPDGQVRPGGREPGGDRGRAAVDGVHAVAVHVVRQPGGAADPRDHDDVLPRHLKLGQERLEGGQDGVVPAAWAPAHLLVRFKIFSGRTSRGSRDHGQRGEPVARVADMGSSPSAGPWPFVSGMADHILYDAASSADWKGRPRTWL